MIWGICCWKCEGQISINGGLGTSHDGFLGHVAVVFGGAVLASALCFFMAKRIGCMIDIPYKSWNKLLSTNPGIPVPRVKPVVTLMDPSPAAAKSTFVEPSKKPMQDLLRVLEKRRPHPIQKLLSGSYTRLKGVSGSKFTL